MKDYSGAPYYSRYMSQHRDKGYTAVLAKPGLAEQASEFNEIQEIQRDYLERLGRSIFTNGSVISGCTLNINGTNVIVSAGSIFLEGLVREIPETPLEITGVGTERIVAMIETTTVTASTDGSLRDPAQGAENYGLEGADREKQVVKLYVLSDTSSEATGAVLFTLENGEELKITSEAENTTVVTTDILAERTFDENGSYKVDGILLKEPAVLEDDKIRINISDGKAYVQGYAVNCASMSHILLDQSTDTRTVTSESHYYNSSYSRYELTNGPVATVTNVTGLVSVIEERKYRGSIRGGYDALNHTPVDKIVSIYEKDSNGTITTTYVQGRDFKLYNDQVDWSLTGDTAIEPTSGTTYYVNYVYNKTMIKGTDYDIENSQDTSYLVLLPGGDRPDDNSRMYISYTYTLARRDLILMTPTGTIDVLKGQPDKLGSLITPYNGSNNYLELGYVDIYPTDLLNSTVLTGLADITNYNSVRFTQEDFYTMWQRIETIEDGLATLDMERDIEEGEDIASLKGYFTDSFRNINKSDLSYTAEIGGETLSYTACIDYDMEELTTAADIQSQDMVINSSSDAYAIYGTVISAPYTEELVLKQSYATGTMLVNPYASYGPLCKIILNPATDNWVDTKTIEVKNTINNVTYSYNTRTYSHGYWSRSATSNLRGYIGSTSTTTTTYAGTTTTNSSASSVAKTIYEYMRVKDIQVEGIAFLDNMRNIYCKFNGVPVDIIASSGTTQGANVTVNGKSVRTVNPNANGHFNGTIKVPSKTPCGTVNVTFTGTNSLGETYSGTGLYSATGTLLTTTITNTSVVTQHYNVLTEIDNLYSSDPLAQSFILDQVNDRVLIKIGLYFATKSSTRPAVLQVRNMVNGYPGETVYAEVTIEPSQVNLPTNPNVPVVTNVTLNQPVYCEKGKYYCFVVLSDSNAYSMYYAEMGKNILGTTQQLVVNPYGVGVLFSSSNASTWTAHQGADLKFELYRSRYTGSGEILFDEASISDVTGIFLDAAYQDNDNVGLDWFYSYRKGTAYSEWLPVSTLTFRDLQSVTDRVKLKAVISTDFSTSPYIDTSRVSLRAFIDQKKATYISTHLTSDDFDEPYQALKISYQAAMPQGADHTIYYMDKMYGDWVEVKAGTYVTLETKKVDEEFTQFTWNISKVDRMVGTSDAGADFFKIRIDLTTNLAYNRPRIKRLSAIFKYD